MGNEKVSEEKRKNKGDQDEKELPFCTTAPSAEHSRSSNDDGPCDDGRAGEVEESEDGA